MLGSAVWIAPAIFATVSDIAQRRMRGEEPASLPELLWSGGDWLIYAFLAPIIFAVSSRWPIVRPHVQSRMAVHLGFALLSCVAWAVGGKLLQYGLNLTLRRDEARQFIASMGDQFWQQTAVDVAGWIFTTLPFGVIVYICVAGMAHAMRYFVEVRDREIQMARLSEQLAGARFAALQAQLNPHFLFNTLNTIAVRARDGDGAGTARMVEQLSEVLRRTLSRHRANEVTVGEELDLVRQYLAIEEARFSDRLRVHFDLAEEVQSAAIPGFALQHLVENAIRHGIARRPGAGDLRIAARRTGGDLEITVTDDGAGIDTSQEMPAGHGIENTRERLRALYGDSASLVIGRAEPSGTVATLRVPYRELLLEADVAEA